MKKTTFHERKAERKRQLVQQQTNKKVIALARAEEPSTVQVLTQPPIRDITIVSIRNPFDYDDKEVSQAAYSPIVTLAGYIRQSPIWDDQTEFVVSVNGGIADPREWDSLTIAPGSFVAICPVVGKGGGGKQILGIIAGIALSVVTMGVGSVASGGAFMGAGSLGVSAWTFGGFLAATATMYLGGMLISHLTPQPSVDNFAASQETPTYSWGRMQALTGQGNPIPITYGTVKSAGAIIAQHISTDGDKQYLNLLLAAGDGPLDDISGIEINDNSVENYTGVDVQIRLGSNDQAPIANFSDQWADKALSYSLGTVNQYATDQTDGNACQGLEITIEFPGGLYHIDDNGNTTSASVGIQAQYRKTGTSTWTDWGTWTLTDSKTSGVRKTFRIDNLAASQYDVRVQCTSRSGTTTRDGTTPYWTQLSGIMYDDFARPGRALLGIKALATDQLSGGVPSITWIQKRLNVWIWDPTANSGAGAYVQKAADNPAWASYDLIHRAKSLADVRQTWANTATTVTGNLAAAIGIGQIVTLTRTAGTTDLKQGDRLIGNSNGMTYGQIVSVSGNTISVLTETTWTALTGAVWKVYRRPYVFKVFGAPAARIIYQDFKDWAEYCDSKGLKVNLLLDKAGDLWTILKEIEGVGRGKVVLKGTRFSAICDKPANPVQMFTMGNIVAGSFKEEFLAVRDRANAIEVTFNNAAKNYQRDTLTVYSDDWNTNTTIKNPTQITFNGITDYNQAYLEAAYRLRLNKYLIRTVHFEAAIDAIACQVGDVILVQHDVPRWGAGGRLMDFSGNPEATTNLLAPNQASFEIDAATGLSTVSYGLTSGATLSLTTDRATDGGKSLKVTTTATANMGVATKLTGLYSGTYTWSVDLWIPTGVSVQLLVRDATNAVSYTGNTIAGNNNWQRATFTFNITTPTTDLSLLLRTYNAVATSFYVDSQQMEAKDHATAFVNGTRNTGAKRIPAATNLLTASQQIFSGMTAYSGTVATYTQGISVPEWGTSAATRIQTTGGTTTLKILGGINTPANGQQVSLTCKIKNQGATTVTLATQIGTAQTIAPGQIGTYTVTGIGNGTSGFQFRLQTANVADPMDVVVFQPMANLGPPSDYTATSWPTREQIRLDREVDLDPSKTYEVKARIGSTDEIVTKAVVVPSMATTTDTLTLSSAFDIAPAEFDVYTFGETNATAKPFRVVNISRSIDQNRRITALEYVDAIYQEATVVPADPFATVGASVRSVNVTQSLDPNYNTLMNISWIPTRGNYGGAIILVDGVQVYRAGISETNTSVLAPDAKTYTISVMGLDILGRQGSPVVTSYTVSIANNGALPNVPGLTLTQQGDQIQAIITTLISNKVKFYELRQGATWDSGILVRKILDDRVTFPAPQNGTITYWIKANDGVGGESAEATGASINVSGIAPRNVLLTRTENMANWTKTGMISRLDGSLSIQCQKAVSGFTKFADMFGGGAKLRTDASITFPALDLGANIIVDGDIYTAVDGKKKIRAIESLSDFSTFAGIFKSTLHYNPVTYATETFAGIAPAYTVSDQIKFDIYYRSSIDGQVWGDWIPAASKQFFGRYVQPKLIPTSLDGNTNTKITGATTTIDVPDLVETITDVAIPAAKTRVDLMKAFTAIDTIAPFTQDASGVQCPYRITNITLSPPGFDVELLNNGALIAGKITKCDIRGY